MPNYGMPLPQVRWNDSDDRMVRSYALRSTEAPRRPWDKFIQTFSWLPGEHVALIGPTGQGKTTMLLNLLPLHPFRVIFGTKPRDDTLQALVNSGEYIRLNRWQSLDPVQFPHRILWPDTRGLNSADKQAAIFNEAWESIYLEGDWTVAVDETFWFSDILKQDLQIKTYLLQARSLNISLLLGLQRPSHVPREIYTSSTHIFFWRVNDRNDLDKIAGIGFLDASIIRNLVANLESHQFLYVNTRTGEMVRSRCPEVKLTESRKGGKTT